MNSPPASLKSRRRHLHTPRACFLRFCQRFLASYKLPAKTTRRHGGIRAAGGILRHLRTTCRDAGEDNHYGRQTGRPPSRCITRRTFYRGRAGSCSRYGDCYALLPVWTEPPGIFRLCSEFSVPLVARTNGRTRRSFRSPLYTHTYGIFPTWQWIRLSLFLLRYASHGGICSSLREARRGMFCGEV